MARYIRKERLRTAIIALSEWRAKTQSQASAHLFPFLSLIAAGVNPDDWVRYEEQADFDFFNRFFLVFDDADEPYFDPLLRATRIASHPHSNVATARKNTFANRWNAAESRVENDETQWKLSPDYREIVRQRVMTRAGSVTRASVNDCAVWLFREHEFPDDASAATLQAVFRESFPLLDEAYNQLFEFTDEPADNIFGSKPLRKKDVREVVESLIVGRGRPEPKPPEAQETSALPEDDPIMQEVRAVIDIGTSGIIFRGCPGTGKTWYAWQIALELTGNKPANIVRLQFHSSVGYEDFVEGYRPTETSKSGFEIVPKKFLEAVQKATETDETIVVIVDEINRGDPSRIFGEVLTYIEDGWRDVAFFTPYRGVEVRVPRNLVVLATMNQHDRSITQLDMAMMRRFDHIDILPSSEKVTEFLDKAGMPQEQASLVVGWFDNLQSLLKPGIGHTYFLNVGDVGKLATVWRYRILPFCESVLEFEPDRLESVKRSYQALERRLLGQNPDQP